MPRARGKSQQLFFPLYDGTNRDASTFGYCLFLRVIRVAEEAVHVPLLVVKTDLFMPHIV